MGHEAETTFQQHQEITNNRFCLRCSETYVICSSRQFGRSNQYSEGPATCHLDTGFSWFPCVYKQMPRWFPRFQVATTRFSCSPPDLNLLVTKFIFCTHVKQPLPPGDNPIAVNNNNIYAGYLYLYS